MISRNVNMIIRAIRKKLNQPLDPLRDTEKRFSEPIEIDLGEAREQKEYKIMCDVIIIADITGNATIYLNEKESSGLELIIGRKLYQDFWRFFISNEEQEGKTCTLIIGREGCFDIDDKDYWLNVIRDKQDEAKAVLDGLAKETGGILDDMKGAIDTVKNSTDLVKGSVDTIQTKVDEVKTSTNLVKSAVDFVKSVVNAVQIGTDKIISGMASDAKLDTIKSTLDTHSTKLDNIYNEVISMDSKVALASKQGSGAIASNNLRAESSADVMHNTTTWTKKKEIRISMTGTYRIKFKAPSVAPKKGYAKIYKNGTPYSGEHYVWHPASEYTWRSSDLFFEAGDLCQIYLKSVLAGDEVHISNFGIYADYAISYGDVLM